MANQWSPSTSLQPITHGEHWLGRWIGEKQTSSAVGDTSGGHQPIQPIERSGDPHRDVLSSWWTRIARWKCGTICCSITILSDGIAPAHLERVMPKLSHHSVALHKDNGRAMV